MARPLFAAMFQPLSTIVFLRFRQINISRKSFFPQFVPTRIFNDNASQTLFELRRKIRAAGGSIREKAGEYNPFAKLSEIFLQDAIVTQRDGRFCCAC